MSLVPSPVTTMTTRGAIDATGAEHPLDVMILATGFQAAKFLHTFDVYGTNGASLHEQWGDEPTAFLGVCVPHIPNFFMLYGPNTNGGEIIPMLENGAAFAVRTIRSIGFRRTGMFVVRGNIHDRYNRWLDGHLRSSVWASTNNYFRSSTGRVVTQWPFGTVLYALLLRLARPSIVMKFPRRRR